MGYNFSNLQGPLDQGDVRNFKMGWNAGVGMSIPMVPGLNFHPEIQLCMRGTSQTYKFFSVDLLDSSETNITRKSNVSFYYLDIPLAFEYGFSSNFKLLAGPYVGWLTAVNIDDEFTEVISTEDGRISSTRSFSENLVSSIPFFEFDAGVVFGFLLNTEKNFQFGVRFNKGFQDVTRTNYDYGKGLDSNISFQMLLGWIF